MSITVVFGRWGLPYLVSIGRWEWTCFRTADGAPRGRRCLWRVQRSPGSDQQLSETVVYCGPIAHSFTRWPKATPLPGENGVRPLASGHSGRTPSSARGV